jgi:hypothetical protein
MKPTPLTKLLLAISNAADIIAMAEHLQERIKTGQWRPKVPQNYHAEAGHWRHELKRARQLYLRRSAIQYALLLASTPA